MQNDEGAVGLLKALEGLTELGQLDILHPHLPDTDYKLPFKRALFEVVFAFTRTARLMDLRQPFFLPRQPILNPQSSIRLSSDPSLEI